MDLFVSESSIVRKIWGKSDTILFIFAGAAAEFALNKSVDWLYFTGKLPSDPIGRLFTTVSYAREIVFSDKKDALKAISKIRIIHEKVESLRGLKIPDSSYRDVLFMLIDYSIRSFELLERKLNAKEKEEIFDVFYRLGTEMGIKGLPLNYPQWLIMRKEHLQNNMFYSPLTQDLFSQYRKHLQPFRYYILLQIQSLLIPSEVGRLMGFHFNILPYLILSSYKFSRLLKLESLIRNILLPEEYKDQIHELDVQETPSVRRCPFTGKNETSGQSLFGISNP